jgi:mxaC protein
MMSFAQPLWLVALPLALLPLVRTASMQARVVSTLALWPRDAASVWMDRALRTLAALAVAATVVALAEPQGSERQVERIGRGAEVVFVFDRSSSMDNPFRREEAPGFFLPPGSELSKAAAARRIIGRFVTERQHDAFALVLFSSQPMAFLPFTQKANVVLAAMDASRIGRGLGNTDIGRAMLAGAAYFDQRPYLGSRVVVLVSDGGAHLDADMRTQLAGALKRNRVGLYWLYLRGSHGRKLVLDGSATAEETASIPEQSLHDYFSKLGLPYRPYDAEQTDAIQRAIDDLSRLEQQPIQYTERLPRRDGTSPAAAVALAALLAWLGIRVLATRRWQ